MEEWDTTAQEAMRASDATGKTRTRKLGPKAKEECGTRSNMKEKCRACRTGRR